jgi:flagellar motor protein MotB
MTKMNLNSLNQFKPSRRLLVLARSIDQRKTEPLVQQSLVHASLGQRLVGFRHFRFDRWVSFLLLSCIMLLQVGCQQSGNGTNRYSSRSMFDMSRRPAWLGGSGNSQLASRESGSSGLDSNGVKYNDRQLAADGGQTGSGQLNDMNQRLGAFDNDNQLLNTEVASLQQRLDMANRYNQQLKEQLTGTSSQVSQVFAEREAAQQQLASLRLQLDQANQNLQLAQQRSAQPANQLASSTGNVPTQLAGGAVLRANNSLMQKVSGIQIRGAQARMDGDVIRIEFPSDTTFVPGTYQIQPSQLPLIQSVAGTIAQQFPRQIVGVEAHWDGSALGSPDVTDHQLTATQSLVVLNELVRLGLPRKQLFTMAMASNRPRHAVGAAGGVSPNRRIEVVIYPEAFEGP